MGEPIRVVIGFELSLFSKEVEWEEVRREEKEEKVSPEKYFT